MESTTRKVILVGDRIVGKAGKEGDCGLHRREVAATSHLASCNHKISNLKGLD